jgi:hypothetical protein
MIAKKVTLWSLAVLLGLTAITATGIGLSAGLAAYSRGQARANAENQVTVTRIDSRARYEAALATRRAQDVISPTLTARYLQYQAIQAQKSAGASGRANTLIYLPAGKGGVPMVQDPQNANRLKP